MAQVQHLSIRQGVYYYARRVPNEVLDRPTMHEAIFDGKAMYRVSLRTKDRSLALQRFQEEDAKFCAKVTLVIGGSVSEPAISRKMAPRGVPRQLTASILNQVEADLAESSFRRWRRLHAVAELGEREREEFQREVDLREQEAESIRAVLIDGEVACDPRLPDIADAAARVAIENNLDVNSPDAMAALRSAVRKGMLAGERRVDEAQRLGLVEQTLLILHDQVEGALGLVAAPLVGKFARHVQGRLGEATLLVLREISGINPLSGHDPPVFHRGGSIAMLREIFVR